MANEVVNRRLNIYIDQATAEQSLERLTKKENDLVAAIERQKKAGKDATRQMNELADTRNRIGQIKDVMDGKVLPSIRMAEAAVQKLNRELKTLPANSEAAAQKLQQLRAAESTLLKVRNAANGVNTSLGDIAKNQGFLGKIQNGLGSLLGSGGLLAGGIIGGAAALGQTITFLSDAVDEALQASEAAARLKGTLDNLGRSDVFERLKNQADAFAESVGYLDNDDIIGVFEQLITYGKLTEKQIMELTPVIIDFAAKQRIQLPEAASAIIKALEGNGKALKEFGIDIKDAKDVTEAYGIVMDQLAPKVSGAAKTFSEELSGSIATTRQEIKNLKEDIGTQLLPVVDRFWKVIRDALGGLKNLVSDLSIISDSDKFSFFDRLSFLTGKADPELRARIEVEKFLQRDRNIVDPATGKDGYGRVYRPDNSTVLGTGAVEDPEEAKRKAAERDRDRKRQQDQSKRERDQALKDLTDVLNRTEEATQPILAAYRKINEQATEDIKKIQAALAKGLISPEQAEQALAGVERVLNILRDDLNKKFKLTSGFLDIIPEGGDIDATTQADAKALGTNIGNKIIEAVGETLQQEGDPISEWINRNSENIDFVFGTVSQLADTFMLLGEVRSNADQAALDKELANNEKRKNSAKDLLDRKLISQQEYERRAATLDKKTEDRQREVRKRQFERDKNAQTVQALMNAASAVLSTLAARPGSLDIVSLGAFRAISLGLIGVTTAAQIAAIRTAKPPQFAKGGFLPDGPSHSQGGIALVDRAGRKVGEVEGGEPILSRKTYARNKPLIDMLMAGSLSGTGIMTMNVPRINNSMRTVFENGGFIPKAGDASNNELTTAVKDLNQILANGIIAKLLYGEYENTSDRINAIRSQSRVS